MKRLRSRLIAAFLGVAILAMVPLAAIYYYTQLIRYQNVRHQWLENALKEIGNYINYQSNVPSNVLLPLAQYLQNRFSTSATLLELLEYSESLDDTVVREQLNWWERQLVNKLLEENIPGGNLLLQLNPPLLRQSTDSLRKNPQYPIQIIPKKPFLKMKEWMDEGLLFEEDDKIYCYKIQPLLKGERLSEMEIVGALFVKILLIEKYPNEPARSPELYLRNKRFDPQPVIFNPQPKYFEKYLSQDNLSRLFGFSPQEGYQEVDIEQVFIDASDADWPQQFRLNPSAQQDESNIFPRGQSDGSATVAMQMKLVPIVNHRRELAAVMVLGVPIASIVGSIGLSLTISYSIALLIIIFAAILFARTIDKPIHELATAARQMTNGDYDVRVREKGTEEQRILGFTFNQLAEQIQIQLVQLKHQTHELETGNRELSQTQHFLKSILENIRTGVMSVDREGRISHINEIGERILGVSDWMEKPVSDLIGCSSFANLIYYSLRQGISVQESEVPYEGKNGVLIPLQVSVVPIVESEEMKGLVVTFHDLSAIRQLEEQIRRQDRLAALGRMAAGVAHEIRNPLGIIRGSAELLHKRFSGQAGEEGLSDFILDEVKRLSGVVNDFLMFARPPEPIREEMTVSSLLQQLTDYFEKQQMGEEYPLLIQMIGDPPPIAADVNQCRQVFLNLFINAQQAMPQGGSIILRALSISTSEVAIEVEDQGVGIHPDRLDKIFDPFYTSKESGTGLGLSLVHQIMNSHGGRVEVKSTPGKGSLFRLIFLTYQSFSESRSPGERFSLPVSSGQ